VTDATLTILLPALTTIAVSVVLPLCMAGLALLQWWLGARQKARDEAKTERDAEIAEQVKEVKVDLKTSTDKADAKTDAIAEVLNDVHTLTNSAMGLALTSNAALARWKANQTQDQGDEDAAIKAENALAEHQAKQRTVDTRRAIND